MPLPGSWETGTGYPNHSFIQLWAGTRALWALVLPITVWTRGWENPVPVFQLPQLIYLNCMFLFISEHYQVKRTCTDNFDVNFFMVNHACMTEGHRHGHMCFCEEDECNAANAIYRSNWKVTLLSSILVTFVTLFHTAVLQRWSNKQTSKPTRKLQNIFVPSQRNATN